MAPLDESVSCCLQLLSQSTNAAISLMTSKAQPLKVSTKTVLFLTDQFSGLDRAIGAPGMCLCV